MAKTVKKNYADYTNVNIKVDEDVLSQAKDIATQRGVSLDIIVSVFLRAMVNNVNRGKDLKLDDKITFGKYYGETIYNIVAADPSYLRFMIGADKPIALAPEVIEMLNG